MSNSAINFSQIHNVNDITPVQWFNIILNDGVHNQNNAQEENMTDKQYDGILHMIGMILDGCKDIEEAKQKIAELRIGQSKTQSDTQKSDAN